MWVEMYLAVWEERCALLCEKLCILPWVSRSVWCTRNRERQYLPEVVPVETCETVPTCGCSRVVWSNTAEIQYLWSLERSSDKWRDLPVCLVLYHKLCYTWRRIFIWETYMWNKVIFMHWYYEWYVTYCIVNCVYEVIIELKRARSLWFWT